MQDIFDEVMECLNDDLGRAQIAFNKAEARD